MGMLGEKARILGMKRNRTLKPKKIKMGKKARNFAKKNLQSVEKRTRKLKPFFRKKFTKRNERHEVEDEEEKKVEQKPKKRFPEDLLQDIYIAAVFGKDDDDEVLSGDDSDTDGFLDELVDEAESDITNPKVLSGSVLSSCFELVDEHQSVQALTSLLNWYKAACYYGHESSRMTGSDIKYDIEDRDTFANVIVFVLQKADATFWDMLGLSDSTSSKEKLLKLKNNPKWDGLNLKPLVKSFLTSTMHLVNKAGDLETKVFALNQLRVYVVFFAAFPDLLKKLIKISVNLWVNGEVTRSQLAFLLLKDIIMVFNLECFETCLINMYRAYLSSCEIPKPNSGKRLRFLIDSFVELSSQDVHKSYAKASVFITQLFELMKSALTTMNEEAVEKIHSEQYTFDLWVNFIAANVQEDYDFQSLLYTTIQFIHGVSQLFTGPSYLLLRVKCIQWLNLLSRSSGLFIPIISLVLDIMEPENWLQSQNSQQQCIFSVIELLAAHFAQWSLHITFPELATIPVMRLGKFNEGCTMEHLKRAVKGFIDQVKLNIEFVQWKIEEVTFPVKDQQSIEAFLQLENQRKNAPYARYYQSIIDEARGTRKMK